MRYEVITACDIDDFHKRTAMMVADGWKPQGGVSISIDGMGQMYAQAFVEPECDFVVSSVDAKDVIPMTLPEGYDDPGSVGYWDRMNDRVKVVDDSAPSPAKEEG